MMPASTNRYQTKTNELLAKSMVYHDRTIAVLTGNRPDFDVKSVKKTIDLLRKNGFYVHEVDVEEFCEKTLANLGFLLLIPHAGSVPALCAGPLKRYWEQGGQVITLGGPLFGRLIEKVDGSFQKAPIDDQMLDATFSDRISDIVIEGITPSYKTFKCDNVIDFFAEPKQVISAAELKAQEPLTVICPCARPHGIGYGNEHRNRFIPLVQVKSDGGRAEDRRGAAAFIMLSDTRAQLPVTSGNRPGTVSATACGSAIGSIGITEQKLFQISGAEKLLLSMAECMRRGLFLYEGGSDKQIYSSVDSAILGAKVLNLSQDFKEVTLEFVVRDSDRIVLQKKVPLLSSPRGYTEFHMDWPDFQTKEYQIQTDLIFENQLIDRIEQNIAALSEHKKVSADEFVQVVGNQFILNGKPYYPLGINYWPFYYPGFERADYWMGWLDKSNYDPMEIEWDLEEMERLGINCVFTRLDGNLDRCIPQLLDFMHRCERHTIKLSLSYPNATCPLYYSSLAFQKLMKEARLVNNPVLFSHDIAWEIGYQFLLDPYRPYWDEPWHDWIEERYGGLENAENDWGVPADRAEDGRVTAPPLREFREDGVWRIKIAAYRRFMDDFISQVWNRAVADMRLYDKRHLIAYRQGPFQSQTVAFTSTNKHIDYCSLEGYEIGNNEKGYHTACINTIVMNHLSGRKPVIWSEFGLSLTGTSRTSLIWDHVNGCPKEEKIREQGEYIGLFCRMFKAENVNGTAPWWWPGGFRRVEMSDFGLCGPDGRLRPSGCTYLDTAEWFSKPRLRPQPTKSILADPDAHVGGYHHFCVTDGSTAHEQAEKDGSVLCIRTEATGTNSVTVPLKAVGNVKYNGSNPLKYLNAEFNYVIIKTVGGKPINVRKGEMIKVPDGELLIDISVGNLQEPTWISSVTDGFGSVSVVSAGDSQLKVNIPITSNVPYLYDAVIEKAHLTSGIVMPTKVSLTMESRGRATFGEIFSFTLIPLKG